MNLLINFLNQQITETDEALTKILSINNYDEEQQIYENETMEENTNKEETKMVKETVYVKKEKRNQIILTTEELENKLDGLYGEFKKDICECILNCQQGTFRIDAILNDNYEIIDYDYDILENNSYRIHNDGYIRINVYYNEQNGFGYDELYDECIKIWCNDHNVQYYDDETGYFYEDYDRDEVSEIFKELYLDNTEFDDRFSENVKYHLND